MESFDAAFFSRRNQKVNRLLNAKQKSNASVEWERNSQKTNGIDLIIENMAFNILLSSDRLVEWLFTKRQH